MSRSPSKRDAIRDAALALFAENGIAATSTRSIAELAETAEGNLYRHFRSKGDLARTLFDECARQIHGQLVLSASGVTDPAERLAALVRGVFAFAESNRAAFDFLQTAHTSGVVSKLAAEERPLPLQLFVETLRAGTAAGTFLEVDPVLTTGWIVALAQRSVSLGGSALVSVDDEDLIRQTVEAALRLVVK